MDCNFVQAQSDNLPLVDAIMVGVFINTLSFVSSEMRGVKTRKSAESSYGDAAVGHVQLKREGSKCIVKGTVCPEHRVRNKPYNVTLVVDVEQEVIDSAECHDCAASLGGCKHAVAFLMWVHRRSEEPSPTAVECYWKKSRLASVGASQSFITAKDFARSNARSEQSVNNFLEEYLDEVAGRNTSAQLVRQMTELKPSRSLSVWQTFLQYVDVTPENSFSSSNFLSFFQKKMTIELCIKAESESIEQSDNPLWYELRYGRITASKIYSAAHCRTPDGVFVEQVIGAVKIKETKAMTRGRTLEEQVLKVVEAKTGIKFKKCGLMILPDHPIIGASPDAISHHYVVEVKCPSTAKSYKTYKTAQNKIAAKYNAQVQLQMFAAKKTEALFCIANPKFEENQEVEIITVDQDIQFINNLIEKAMNFWSNNIFNILLKAAIKH